MKVRFTATAVDEIQKIHDYIAEHNPMAAKAVLWRIEELVARISRFPNIARAVDPTGLRVFPVVPFPYLVFYTVGSDEVIIRKYAMGDANDQPKNRHERGPA